MTEKKIEKMSQAELRAACLEARETIIDLMKSHEELMAGVGSIVCDYALLNECRIAGNLWLRRYE